MFLICGNSSNGKIEKSNVKCRYMWNNSTMKRIKPQKKKYRSIHKRSTRSETNTIRHRMPSNIIKSTLTIIFWLLDLFVHDLYFNMSHRVTSKTWNFVCTHKMIIYWTKSLKSYGFSTLSIHLHTYNTHFNQIGKCEQFFFFYLPLCLFILIHCNKNSMRVECVGKKKEKKIGSQFIFVVWFYYWCNFYSMRCLPMIC